MDVSQLPYDMPDEGDLSADEKAILGELESTGIPRREFLKLAKKIR